MKNLKRIMSGALALALALAMSLSVSAATVPSKEASGTKTESDSSSSPKTGMESGWELYALGSAALAACGISFSRKKED